MGLRGPSNGAIRSEYTLADLNMAPGNEYQRASFVDKVRGHARALIKFRKPWLEDTQFSYPNGFYVPNCVETWDSRNIP